MDQLWLLLVLWVIAAILGGTRKKRPPPPRQVEPGAAPSGGGLMGELNRALEELKRAEARARGKQPASSPRLEQDEAGRARAYLEQRKAVTRVEPRKPERRVVVPKPAPPAPSRSARRPAMPLADEADMSSEDTDIAIRDYDEEAAQLVQARIRGADRGVREAVSLEELSAEQRARRRGRPAVAIGTRAEHAEWHRGLEAGAPPPQAPERRGRLSRFADGSLRGAVVLADILGRPVGER